VVWGFFGSTGSFLVIGVKSKIQNIYFFYDRGHLLCQFQPQDSVCLTTQEFKLRHKSTRLGKILMSGETDSSKEETMNEQVDPVTPEVEAAIQKIKQPPAIDDVLMELPPEELLSNPAVAPEMLNEGEGLRDDLRRDD